MSEMTENFQERKLFIERLYKELQTVQEFRFKYTITKITFVIGLLGIGTVKLHPDPNITLSPALLLAPLVAVLFDILGMAATLAIYRIKAFLGGSGIPGEKEWQGFSERQPLSFSSEDLSLCFNYPFLGSIPRFFSLWAAEGFTLITFLASSIAILLSSGCKMLIVSLILFVPIWLFWRFFRCLERKVKDKIRSENLENKV